MTKELKIEEPKTLALIISDANKIVIKKNEDIVVATEFLSKIKAEKTSLKEQKDSYTQPLNASLKKLNADYKTMVAPLEEAETYIKSAITELRIEQEKERKVREKELKKENGKDAFVEQAPAKFEGEQGELRFKKTWTFTITSEKKIPREYLKADEVKIRKAVVSDGVRRIEGIKIFQKETPAIY